MAELDLSGFTLKDLDRPEAKLTELGTDLEKREKLLSALRARAREQQMELSELAARLGLANGHAPVIHAEDDDTVELVIKQQHPNAGSSSGDGSESEQAIPTLHDLLKSLGLVGKELTTQDHHIAAINRETDGLDQEMRHELNKTEARPGSPAATTRQAATSSESGGSVLGIDSIDLKDGTKLKLPKLTLRALLSGGNTDEGTILNIKRVALGFRRDLEDLPGSGFDYADQRTMVLDLKRQLDTVFYPFIAVYTNPSEKRTREILLLRNQEDPSDYPLRFTGAEERNHRHQFDEATTRGMTDNQRIRLTTNLLSQMAGFMVKELTNIIKFCGQEEQERDARFISLTQSRLDAYFRTYTHMLQVMGQIYGEEQEVPSLPIRDDRVSPDSSLPNDYALEGKLTNDIPLATRLHGVAHALEQIATAIENYLRGEGEETFPERLGVLIHEYHKWCASLYSYKGEKTSRHVAYRANYLRRARFAEIHELTQGNTAVPYILESESERQHMQALRNSQDPRSMKAYVADLRKGPIFKAIQLLTQLAEAEDVDAAYGEQSGTSVSRRLTEIGKKLRVITASFDRVQKPPSQASRSFAQESSNMSALGSTVISEEEKTPHHKQWEQRFGAFCRQLDSFRDTMLLASQDVLTSAVTGIPMTAPADIATAIAQERANLNGPKNDLFSFFPTIKDEMVLGAQTISSPTPNDRRMDLSADSTADHEDTTQGYGRTYRGEFLAADAPMRQCILAEVMMRIESDIAVLREYAKYVDGIYLGHQVEPKHLLNVTRKLFLTPRHLWEHCTIAEWMLGKFDSPQQQGPLKSHQRQH